MPDRNSRNEGCQPNGTGLITSARRYEFCLTLPSRWSIRQHEAALPYGVSSRKDNERFKTRRFRFPAVLQQSKMRIGTRRRFRIWVVRHGWRIAIGRAVRLIIPDMVVVRIEEDLQVVARVKAIDPPIRPDDYQQLFAITIDLDACAFHRSQSRLMPDSYETIVGERGMALSGGQRQRLALATSPVSRPAVLLLDDTTSVLDPATETRVRRTLLRLMQGRTCFVVTHRVSIVMDGDLVLMLDGGRWNSLALQVNCSRVKGRSVAPASNNSVQAPTRPSATGDPSEPDDVRRLSGNPEPFNGAACASSAVAGVLPPPAGSPVFSRR